jgi:hypothetical protein
MGRVKVPCITPERGQFVLGHPERMRQDPRVGRPHEQGGEVLDVLVDAVGVVPVGPVHAHVLRVALAKARPVGVGEHLEVELVEGLQVLALDTGQVVRVGRVRYRRGRRVREQARVLLGGLRQTFPARDGGDGERAERGGGSTLEHGTTLHVSSRFS